ncbi:MAG: hypothetical protein ACR2QU_12190 [Gammaproteobacteria bacterium]
MRSGFHHSWQAASDSDAELQADVMRFVAIVALCIVAISTLVEEADAPVPQPQTISDAHPRIEQAPGTETDKTVPVEVIADAQEPEIDSPMVATPPIPPLTSARVRTGGVVPIIPPAIEEKPDPARAETEAEEITQQEVTDLPAESQSRPPAPKKGFTLRFESDAAFLRLVAAGAADLFVFGDEGVLRLIFDQKGARFRAGPRPGRFHAIAPDTVPATLQAALVESGHDASAVVWGVTLPVATQSMLSGILRNNEGGELIIRANGDVYLENNDV